MKNKNNLDSFTLWDCLSSSANKALPLSIKMHFLSKRSWYAKKLYQVWTWGNESSIEPVWSHKTSL